MDASPTPFWDQQRQTRLQQLHFHNIALASPAQRMLMRDELLQDVDALAALACEFKFYVNQTSFISRLPAELMTHIFRHLTEVARYNSSTSGLGWITASHVCHSWREILLGAREIWAEEIGTIPKWRAISTFLQRAGENIPLRISVESTGVTQVSSIWMRGRRDLPLSRAHTISWEINHEEDVEPFLKKLAGENWPQLKELETRIYGPGGEPEDYKFPVAQPFCAPSLRKWTSESLYIPLRAQSMVTLDLRDMELEAAALLEILAYSLLLETVIVIDSSVNDDTHLRDRLHASLHQLRSFQLRCDDITGDELNRAVMTHIDFPVSVDMDLSAELMNFDVDYSLLTTIVRDQWPQHVPLSVTISHKDITFRASEASGYRGSRTMSFHDLAHLSEGISLLKVALNSELQRVDHLSISQVNVGDVAQMWTLASSIFPAVQRLDVIEGGHLDNLVLLREAQAESREYIFPRLRHLKIAQCILRNITPGTPTGAARLYLLLRTRIRDGAGPSELWLDGLVEPEGDADADALRALVPVIHWAESVGDADVQDV